MCHSCFSLWTMHGERRDCWQEGMIWRAALTWGEHGEEERP
ncbi:Alpha-methylacyl-CoA racemase [Altererythrobacter epoxidivorans]|uniref:Alpha-methylacyl-CoA racemase n=1 Tax=Altererythrobacter epoxidivorans TaxID=361183 RepID=A0A0M4LSI0_9SPHN|nr:Alpha-methylacyl-CoA racemase [Altererythrobacter epoxidivorans]